MLDDTPVENLYSAVEDKLRPLASPLPQPRPGDWLAEHREKGQTFRQYLSANPVRRDRELRTIYLCLVGEFIVPQGQIVERTREFLNLFFDVPIRIRRHLAVSDIPAYAKRKHPAWGDRQLLSTYLLEEVLRPERPDDALAYLALTARDLWAGEGWNFVFGQANLRQRVGVWSIYRNGWPGKSEAAYRLCLRRTLATAAHETCHVLTMRHCTAYSCLMNGCNHLAEADHTPLHLCPVCLRKLCWNLQVEPIPYLQRLGDFCSRNGIDGVKWYAKAASALEE